MRTFRIFGFLFALAGFFPFAPAALSEPVPVSTAMKEIGRLVTDVQKSLAKKGYYKGAIDGRVGPKMKAALGRFQKDNGIKAESFMGDKTRKALGVELFKACFWLLNQLKCPLGCSASIAATQGGVRGYIVKCPRYDDTLVRLPNR